MLLEHNILSFCKTSIPKAHIQTAETLHIFKTFKQKPNYQTAAMQQITIEQKT